MEVAGNEEGEKREGENADFMRLRRRWEGMEVEGNEEGEKREGENADQEWGKEKDGRVWR
jgi:hypothetical protein